MATNIPAGSETLLNRGTGGQVVRELRSSLKSIYFSFGEFMASFFKATRRVEFCETDMAGIVHFSNFYKWMEQCEHEFFRSLGLSIVEHQADGSTVGWPRVSSQCRFESPAHYEDVLEMLLTVQRIGVKSLSFDIAFTNNGRSVARGTMKTVCCILRPGQPLESLEIPDAYRSKMEEYQ